MQDRQERADRAEVKKFDTADLRFSALNLNQIAIEQRRMRLDESGSLSDDLPSYRSSLRWSGGAEEMQVNSVASCMCMIRPLCFCFWQ